MSEICALCKSPMICGHSLTIDSHRLWRLCCLCVAELMNELDVPVVAQP